MMLTQNGKQFKTSSSATNLWIPSCAEAIEYPDASGLVYKKGKYFGGWKPRWFVAKNGILYYFDVKDDKPIGSPMGSFTLSKCSALHTSGGWAKGYSFKLSEFPSRAYSVALLSEPDMNYWISFIAGAGDAHAKKAAAATKIQALFRGMRTRRKWVKLINASITLQTHLRKWGERTRYLVNIKRILKAQAIAKCWLARSHFKYSVKRKRIIAELLATERSYVANLKLSIEIFIVPLQHLAKKEPWAKRAIEEIFANWETIYILQYNLLKELEERSSAVVQMIGDLFLKEIDQFKAYANYVNNFDKSLAEVARLNKTYEAFKTIVLTAQSDPRCKAMDLPDYLILPIQRLPRYSMLLKDLIKNTPRSHVDYRNLVEAEIKVREVTMFINEQKRDADNLATVNEIKSQITGKLSKQLNFGVQPKLLIKGEVRTPAFGGDYAFLFTEVLLTTKPKRDAKYHLEDIMPLQNAIVTFGTVEPASPSMTRIASLDLEPSSVAAENGSPKSSALVVSKSENHIPVSSSTSASSSVASSPVATPTFSRKKSMTEFHSDSSTSLSSSPISTSPTPQSYLNPNNFKTPHSPNPTPRTASPTPNSRGGPPRSTTPTPISPRVGLKAAPPARPHATTFSPTTSSKHPKPNNSNPASPAPTHAHPHSPSLAPSPSVNSLSPVTPRPPRSPSFKTKEERAIELMGSNWIKVICPTKEVLLVFANAEDVETWKKHIQSAIAVLEEKKRALITSKVTMLYQ